MNPIFKENGSLFLVQDIRNSQEYSQKVKRSTTRLFLLFLIGTETFLDNENPLQEKTGYTFRVRV